MHIRDAMRHDQVPFSQVLKASIERPDQMRAYCPSCRRYQMLHTTRNIQRLPTVLIINASIHSPEARQIWSIPNWLPQEIGLIVNQGQVFCYQGQDLQLHVQRGVYNILVYELVGVVCDINTGDVQSSHPVSVINGEHCVFVGLLLTRQWRYRLGSPVSRTSGICSTTS
jgi:PAB-dependent poly(A)-specific ribonuclease subunit 2